MCSISLLGMLLSDGHPRPLMDAHCSQGFEMLNQFKVMVVQKLELHASVGVIFMYPVLIKLDMVCIKSLFQK
ncbi:hypothetical protein RchiOBHm_Chr7g0229751 [Rosa chinensis]|uniref:Uncharacterized protein n=1 Tax=Rosa chinensis TaxID=74649 RepID=A0A2P6PF75_ROSCH|nr:hypothetical protein RchiOBHm_Chr7g0229751 [Rosa chinensis]